MNGRRPLPPATAAIPVLIALAGCTIEMAQEASVPETDTGATYRFDPAASADPEAIRPITVAVPDAALTDLQDRLALTRLPDRSPGSGWQYGTNRAYLEELLAYWRNDFDWRVQEERINELDHFVTRIDGIDLHFVHQRAPNPDAIPLLVTHGWPGSFVEFLGVVGPLTDPVAHGGDAADAFHVVAPSLPGFGFSSKPTEPGYGPERMAEILAALMERLGYDRYGLQGGDWGAIIGRSHAGNHADNVIGLHSNFVLSGPPPGVDPEEGVPEVELQMRRERTEAFAEGSAYQDIQGTKPQTLGYGLNDSPAGLAAWIVEKFHGWSDNDGSVDSAFTKDEILTNVTLYWVTETITSSMRIYYESRHMPTRRPVGFVEVPTGAAIFPKEIYFTPRRWAESRYNIVRWTVMPRGGHFAALEEPELLVDDVRAFFRALR